MPSSPDADLLIGLPARSSDQIARLPHLTGEARKPVVMVLGKYNHGKSKLLNELIGREVFFDLKEQALLQQLREDRSRSGRAAVIVLSMIEQLDEAQLQQVLSAMKKQAPDFEILPVSSIRHQKGREEGETVMLEKSGFEGELRQLPHEARTAIQAA